MNALLAALVLAGTPAAAPAAKPAEAKPADAAKPAEAKAGDVLLRGEKLKGLPAVELTRITGAPAEFDGKTVCVEGTVRQACQKKGCWMELSTADNTTGVRVTFKDYGFFVPMDSAGKKVKLEGVVKVAELSEAKAKHYEAEGAKVAKDKDGKYKEVQLVASGLELR